MGNNPSQFTEEELRDYEDLTYFSKKEILLWVINVLQLFLFLWCKVKNSVIMLQIIMKQNVIKFSQSF